MGQKVNPIGLRLGIIRTWDSRWYADGNYAEMLEEDLKIRDYLDKRLVQAGVSRIVIERPAKKSRITIHTARPGIVIGKKGADIEKLRAAITKMTGADAQVNIVEIRKPEIDAQLVAENVGQQMERRVSIRRAMKRVVQSAMRLGAKASGSTAPVVWAAPKSPARSGTGKAGCLCTRSAPMWITARRRRRRLTAPAASRSGYLKATSWPMIPWPWTNTP